MHVTSNELGAALGPRTRLERNRYRTAQRAHAPTLVEHSPAAGDGWRGFTAIELDGITSGLVLVALPGHTRGHAAVAVDAGDRWVLHAGDAFYHHGQVDGSGSAPATLRRMERAVAHDWDLVQANHARLAGGRGRRRPRPAARQLPRRRAPRAGPAGPAGRRRRAARAAYLTGDRPGRRPAPAGTQDSGATRTSSLPTLRPTSRPRNASGAASSPSTTSSR